MDPVVKFLPSERTVSVPAGTSLLDAVRLAGLPIAMGCSGGGACGRCGLRVLTGPIDSPDDGRTESRVRARNRIDPDLRLACLLAVSADMTVTAPYW